MTLIPSLNEDNLETVEEVQMNVFEVIEEMEKVEVEVEVSCISSTSGSQTGLESVTASVTKQHQAAQASLLEGEVMPNGQKVRCERLNKDGVVYSSRRHSFNKPNGTTEIVLQYYVDFGGDEYRWLDGDVVSVV
jgi:hypothetical protein